MPERQVPSRLRPLLALSAGLLLIAAIVATTRSGGPSAPPKAGVGQAARSGDPFGYVPSRQAEYVSRATAGCGQVLFTKSPGGAVATAARVASYRGLINAATRGTGIDPDLVEGIVFVESAGRPYVIAGSDPTAAAGLTQILADTGTALLGMHIDLAQSRKLLHALDGAQSAAQARSIIGRLARADDRFNPPRAIAATVRYLRTAQQRFGRRDLAVASYHMGIGNLGTVLARYDGGRAVPYAQLYFDTAPDRHADVYRLLTGFGDQSSLYLWRVLGAVQIMRLYRNDRSALTRLASLQTALDSSAEVLHPPDRTQSFADPSALSSAYASRTLVPLPSNAAALGYAPAAGMARAAGDTTGAPPGLYRGLRPAALDLLGELAARVRSLSGLSAPLTVARTVSDRAALARIGEPDPTVATGFTLTLARRYAAPAQAQALQALLDRLTALDLIAWARRGNTLSVTVAGDASHVIASGV